MGLKIGFVLDDTLDTPDGVQQYVLALGKWMAAEGHEVHYIVGRTVRRDIANVHSIGRNVRVSYNGNRMSTPLPASRRMIRKLLHEQMFDVLHVQLPYSPFLAGRIIAAAPEHTAVFGTFHIAPNSAAVTATNSLLATLNSRTLKRFDTIVSVSPAASEFAQKTHKLDTVVLPNVVNTAHFKTAKPLFSDNTKTIVFLGRLVPRKGCMILLQAVALLGTDNLPDYRVVICGKGPLDAELRSYSRAHGLDGRISFAGFVDDDLKARYLKSADIAVFPSTGGESFGIVLLEAMAADNPVVLGADNPGYASVLAPYPNLLFKSSDPAALAEHLQKFLTEDAACNAALSWQRSYIPGFDVAVVGARLIARYQEALRSRRRT